MIVDFHTHAFPDGVAPKVVRQLEEHYGIAPFGAGTRQHLLASLDEAGISLGVVSTAATRPEQVHPANEWAARLNREHPWTAEGPGACSLIAFGTIHPDHPDIAGELSRLKSLGIRGLKLHPDFQAFDLDSPRARRMFTAIGSDFILLLHVGDRPGRARRATPDRLRRLLAELPELRVVAAHFGGFHMWAEAKDELLGLPVYLDTSSSLAFLSPGEACELIRRHGPDRVVFGSDFPLWSPAEELERLRSLPLTRDELQLILEGNARRLLGL